MARYEYVSPCRRARAEGSAVDSEKLLGFVLKLLKLSSTTADRFPQTRAQRFRLSVDAGDDVDRSLAEIVDTGLDWIAEVGEVLVIARYE